MKKQIRLPDLETSDAIDSMVAELEGTKDNTDSRPFPLAGSAAVGKTCQP